MSNIILPHGHTIIGGLDSQMQSPLAAHLIYSALAGDPKLQAVTLVEDEADGCRFAQAAQEWARTEKRTIKPWQTAAVSNMRLKRDADDIMHAIDRHWNFGRLMLVRDTSLHKVIPPGDRLFGWITDAAHIYNASNVSVLATGAHHLQAQKLTDYRADQVWQCEAAGSVVKLTSVVPADARKIEFAVKYGTGITTFNEVEKEHA